MRSYKVTDPASTYVLTTSEVKEHLKIDSSVEDTYIDSLIIAAQNSCEEYTNRFFIDTTLNQYCDTWEDAKELLKNHVRSVTEITYYDSDNSLQTLATSVYTYDSALMPTRIALKPSQSFPAIVDKINAVIVEYDVGAASASAVDNAIKQAVLLTIGNWYQNRAAVIVGRQVNALPMSAKYLLDQYRVQVVR